MKHVWQLSCFYFYLDHVLSHMLDKLFVHVYTVCFLAYFKCMSCIILWRIHCVAIQQSPACNQTSGTQDPVSSGVGGYASAYGKPTNVIMCAKHHIRSHLSFLQWRHVCTKVKQTHFKLFSGSGDVHEELWEAISQWSGKVSLSQWAHQSGFTQGNHLCFLCCHTS